MGLSGHASGAAVEGVTIAMTVLAGMAVSARLSARIGLVRNGGLDDVFIMAALLLSIATTVTMCLQVRWGMGQHMASLSLHEAVESQKPFYVSVWVYNLGMSATKFSILLQYLRIFPQVHFRRSCFAMMVVVGIYAAWTFFSAVFACWPISYFWTQVEDPTGGRCLNRFAVWFANAGMNIATDIGVGLLPMRVLRELELPRRHKIALMIVFGLGGFTCVVSVLRLQSLYVISKAKDVTWENPLAAIWSSVEMNTGILCSCLPTLKACISRYCPQLLDTMRSNGTRDEKCSHPSNSSSGTKQSEPPPQLPVISSQGTRTKTSLDALGRGLSGRGELMSSSYAYSEHDSSSEEIFELAGVSASPEDSRQIQVTTTWQQDVESIESHHEDGNSSMSRFGRIVRAVSQGSQG